MILYVPLRPGEQPGYIHTRPHFIADSLDDLRGPTTGRVELPDHLRPGTDPGYDLDDPDQLTTLYAHVLLEAMSLDDLSLINARLLCEHWTQLRLPDYLRTMWHMAHPRLGLGLTC